MSRQERDLSSGKPPRAAAPETVPEKAQTIVFLRWILIIATGYLLLFHRPFSETPPLVALFVAAYLGSNLVVGYLLPRVRSQKLFHSAIVLFDTFAVSMGLLLTQNTGTDFFLLYFVVMLVGAFTERLEAVVGAAVLISVVHVFTVARFVSFDALMSSGQLLRIPFLFVVALFFGHLVQRARQAEREAEEAKLQERKQKDIVAGITHDLKNPLGVIRGMAEMLLEAESGPLTDQQSDLIRRIHNSAQRVITLSLNLLDATRIDVGRMVLHKTPAQLEDIVEETFTVARSASDLKDISLDFIQRDLELPTIDVDVVHLGRVVWNLIDNAIKYTPAGGSVIVSVGQTGDHLYFSVSDTGRGIQPDQIPTLFDRYHETSGDNRMGSGLGLYIVKAITEAHGGEIVVDSMIGKGTTFTIRLPAQPSTRVVNHLQVAAQG
jgi:signal transduction histidine kinase